MTLSKNNYICVEEHMYKPLVTPFSTIDCLGMYTTSLQVFKCHLGYNLVLF